MPNKELNVQECDATGVEASTHAGNKKNNNMNMNHSNKLLQSSLLKEALKESFLKLHPAKMFRNPVMFTVWVGTWVMAGVCIWIATGEQQQGSLGYNIIITAVLFITLLFANFAEAIAEARGKAQANSLRKTREETPAKWIQVIGEMYLNEIKIVPSSQLNKGDLFLCEAGDIIPSDGEIIEGLATIDESAITGESAPVIREAGGDKSSVTGGTKVLSDKIKVRVTTEAGESFLDKMIALVEGASRQKTPNEIALTILLAGFTLVFIIVSVTLKPFADYAQTPITIAAFISLFVCLIPTTIGGLLSAIGIAGMDRALRANVITKSGKAVETAGDIDVLLLDKTGTITIGNRKATNFYPAGGINEQHFIRCTVLSSMSDDTPEGKSIIELAGINPSVYQVQQPRFIKFTAETRSSGIDLPVAAGSYEHTRIRKGAADAIRQLVEKAGNSFPADTAEMVKIIASNGGTPLVVSENEKVLGVIELQDIIKTGIRERFERLRKMGIKTVMVTGDNPLTAKFIAEKAGVDDFIAEAKPEDKMNYIRKEQSSGRLVAMMGDGTNDAPALAQADVGVAMNSGTQAAKEAGNMVDLDNDPTKLIEVVEIGKQLLMTRGTLTTFSIANDVAKYFAIVPALFIASIPALEGLNIMKLHSPESAILSAVIFNAIIIPLLIPLALKGVAYKPIGASALLRRNLLIYGLGGVIVPFIGIKLIDLLVAGFI
jgi:K+-transporting ATPase ATPase B chain